MSMEPVILQNWLEVETLQSDWRRRWFVLTPGNLSFYVSNAVLPEEELGTFSLMQATLAQSTRPVAGREFGFTLELNGGRCINLSAYTDQIRSDWVQSLTGN